MHPSSTKYGVLVGRFQPFHKGHEGIIRGIIADGRKPVIFIGSINRLDERNPLPFVTRRQLIGQVFTSGEVKILGIEDKDNDEAWFEQIHDALQRIGAKPSDTPFYLYTKPGEYDWSLQVRKKGYWIQIPTTQIEGCHAALIRKDFAGHKHFLNPIVADYIQEQGLL